MNRARAFVFGLILSLTTSHASAQTPPARTSLLDKLTAGRDLLDTAPTIAVFDGSWSLTLQASTLFTNRTWNAPYPKGLLAHEATRVLYGTTWTAMLGIESLVAVMASDGKFAWLGEATYRTDWVFGLSVPACPYTGAYGGCGVGVGGFGGLHVRPLGSHWWFEVSGGWIQQRVANDENRTLAESAWIMTPLAAAYEVRAGENPVALRVRAGPGAYFGMHNAHVHPTELGAPKLDVPWHEIFPLDAGLGPGARMEARLIFLERLSLDAEVVLAPLFIGGPTTSPPREVAPLDAPRGGIPTWRYVGLGASWDRPDFMPMRVGLSFFGAELSGRPITKLGHQGVMLRFEFPLRVGL